MLQTINLSKAYQGHQALQDLNLTVKKGEIFALLGQNGAGKTTTINIFLGFVKPTSGQALIDGLDVSLHPAETRKLTAYIPEVVQLYGNLDALENLDFFSRLAGFRYSEERRREFLSMSGLQQEAFTKRLSGFSKGMRQKVGIAIAVAKNAAVIFMDEPTSGLDPKATEEFTGICRTLCTAGKTVLMATHDIFNAVTVADRIGIMKQGKLEHIIRAQDISAPELQKIYLETI